MAIICDEKVHHNVDLRIYIGIKKSVLIVLLISTMLVSTLAVSSSKALDLHNREDYILHVLLNHNRGEQIQNITEQKWLKYIGKPLNVLCNTSQIIIPIGFHGNRSDYTSFSELFFRQFYPVNYYVIVYPLKTGDPEGKIEFLCREQGQVDEWYDEELNMLIHINKSSCYTFIATENGFFIYTSNKTVENIALVTRKWIDQISLNIKSFILQHNIALHTYTFEYNLSVNVSYVGISADEYRIVWRQEFRKMNDTYLPYNYSVVELINPYHKFYILINDIRIVYPLKFGLEQNGDKWFVKYVELYLPLLSTRHLIFVEEEVMKVSGRFFIDENYLNTIKELYVRYTNLTNTSIDDLIIADIYYIPTQDKYLVPYLIIYKNNSNVLLSMYLYKEEPVVDDVIVFAGSHYEPEDLDYKELLSLIIEKHKELIERRKFITYSLTSIVALTLIAIGIYVFKKIKK